MFKGWWVVNVLSLYFVLFLKLVRDYDVLYIFKKKCWYINKDDV